MGEINKDNVNEVKVACAKVLCEYLNIINTLDEVNLLYFLVILTQYVYAKFYKCGKIYNNKYYVYSKNIEFIFAKAGFAGYFTILVDLRNALCHEYGTYTHFKTLREFRRIRFSVPDFLFYVLSDEECLHNHIIQEYCDKHNIVDKAQFEEEMKRLSKLCGSTDKKIIAFFIKDNLL